MSILEIIEKYANISPAGWNSMTDQEIIRMEKKLRAEAKMSDTLDINQVEMVMDLVKHKFGEMSTLYRPEYKRLREILLSKKKIVAFPAEHIKIPGADENLRKLIEEKFGTELHDYTMFCLKHEHYNGLYSLLFYKDVLPEYLLDELIKKLSQKIEFATECVRMMVSDLDSKIVYAMNPFFYRCLNQIGPGHFEGGITDLYNRAVDNLKKRKKLFMRFLYAISYFKAINTQLKEIFSDNRKRVYELGTREVSVMRGNTGGKGGTYVNKYAENDKSGSGFRAGWIIVVILIGVIKVGLMVSKSNRRHDYKLPEYNTTSLMDSKIEERLDHIYEMQDTALDVLEAYNCQINVSTTGFTAYNFMNFLDYGLTVRNFTDQPVILLLEAQFSAPVLFLEPEGVDSIDSQIKGFKIYTGSKPEQIIYTYGYSEQEGFRFGEFDEDDRKQLDQHYELNDISPIKHYNIDLKPEDGRISVQVYEREVETVSD